MKTNTFGFIGRLAGATMFFAFVALLPAQQPGTDSNLTLERIFNSSDFRQQSFGPFKWLQNGDAIAYISRTAGGAAEIRLLRCRDGREELLVAAAALQPAGRERQLPVDDFFFSANENLLLIYTNSKRVWRSNSRGDYWLLDRSTGALRRLGAGLPPSSLMFAKIDSDGGRAAYVSGNDLYLEELASGRITRLTRDGSDSIVNGAFDWAYEEEFFCRDGFRWSADGRSIAFWQLDSSKVGKFQIINNTATLYPAITTFPYPKVGEAISSARTGVVDVASGRITWFNLPPMDQMTHYLPRMQWIGTSSLLLWQVNRHQNELKFWLCDADSGSVRLLYSESDPAWVDVIILDEGSSWSMQDLPLLDGGRELLHTSEKNGWRSVYRLDCTSGQLHPVSGAYDVAWLYGPEPDGRHLLFSASPDNPTQRYLYRIGSDGTGLTRLSPAGQSGIHSYSVAPNARWAVHTYSTRLSPPRIDLIALPGHETVKVLCDNQRLRETVARLQLPPCEFFRLKTADGISIDGVLYKPDNFDPGRKYPLISFVYGEPWGQIAIDRWDRGLYHAYLARQGYLVVMMDNRGTPSLKGRDWRKSIYRQVGVLNACDQAQAVAELTKWPFVDSARVGVWGRSGGGSLTLSLLFLYPDIYRCGVAVASVPDQRYYNSLYQERYMGQLGENPEAYREGSPISHAANLRGDLLIIHGTGDDNVHYQGAEALINELVRLNKPFQMMAYPNRGHGINEGENTARHVYELITRFFAASLKPELPAPK